MKHYKAKQFSPRMIILAALFTLFFLPVVSATAATTNTVGSKPLVLIGASGSAGTLTISETGAAALSQSAPFNTVALQLPEGVTFGSAPQATVTAGSGLTLQAAAGDITDNTRAVWTITASSTLASDLVIQIPSITLSASVSPGDIIAEIESGPQPNPGLTGGNVAIATATEGGAVAVIDEVRSVSIGGNFLITDDIKIFESTKESLKETETVVFTLPSGVTFDPAADPAISGTNGIAFGSAVIDTNRTTVSWLINTDSTAASTVTIANIEILADSGVSPGDVVADLSSGDVFSQSLTIATAAFSGISAKAVPSATATFGADTAQVSPLPESPAGRIGAVTAGINVVEIFGDDLDTGDTLTLALPSGATFSSDYTTDVWHLTESHPDPTGFDSTTLTIAAGASAVGGLLIGNSGSFKVTLDDTVAAGPLSVNLSGTVKGNPFTPMDIPILTIVESGVTIEANTTVPTVGIGASSSAFGTFTITESNSGTLLANNSTITVALPSGVTFVDTPANPAVNVPAPGDLATGTTTLSTDLRTATIRVTTASTTPSTLEISGNIAIDTDFAPGPISADIGGTSGAAGTVMLATASDAVIASVTSTPSLLLGTPTQDISNVVLTEAFSDALNPGAFRLRTSSGSWASSIPNLSSTNAGITTNLVTSPNDFDGSDDSSGNIWDFDIATTFTNNDTLVVYIPDNVMSTQAASVTISNLRLNIPNDAQEGEVNLFLTDGDAGGNQKAGIKSATLLAGFIGTVEDLTTTPSAVEIPAGTSADLAVSGGIGTYTATSSNESVATVTVSGSTVTVMGVGEGTANITVSDGTTPADTVSVPVIVNPAADLTADPATLDLIIGTTGEVTVTGGFTPYTAVSGDDTVATVSVSGGTLTVTGVAAGTAAITVSDAQNPADTTTVTVTVNALLPLAVSPDTLTLNVGQTGDLTVTGGIAPYTAVSSEPSTATVSVNDAVVTVTGAAVGTAVVTVTDTNGASVTASVTVNELLDPPTGQDMVILDTKADIAKLPVSFGDVASTEDGKNIGVSANFPAYSAPVDIWYAFALPGFQTAFLFTESDGFEQLDLTSGDPLNIVPFRVGVTDAFSVQLIPEFAVCDPLLNQPTVPTGTWTVVLIVAPTNGGNFEAIGQNGAPFEQTNFTFEVGCD